MQLGTATAESNQAKLLPTHVGLFYSVNNRCLKY